MNVSMLLMATLAANAPFGTDLIGSLVPPYPYGVKNHMGTCIPVESDICAYAISSLNDPDGNVIAIAAEKGLGHTSDGRGVFQILDIIEAPRKQAGQIWAFEECHLNGVVEPTTIALVEYEVVSAWIEARDTVWSVRFDIDSQALVQLPPSQVQCILPGS